MRCRTVVGKSAGRGGRRREMSAEEKGRGGDRCETRGRKEEEEMRGWKVRTKEKGKTRGRFVREIRRALNGEREREGENERCRGGRARSGSER